MNGTDNDALDPASKEAAGSEATFLTAGGEMAGLIRAFDWSKTSLGPIERWTESLKAAIGTALMSPVPIVMLWGEDGIMIYNDAYSVFAGGRHPQLLGSKMREGWPEVADFNDNVMKVGLAGGTLTYKDQELTLYRTGKPEQVWMNLDYSPILDERGRPAGVVAIVVETTQRVRGERRLQSSEERLRVATDAAAIGTWDFDPTTGTLSWDDRCKELFGLPPETEVDYNTFLAGLHPDDREVTDRAVQAALDPNGPGSYDVEYRTVGLRDGVERFIAATGRAYLEGAGADKHAVRFVGTVLDITERKRTEAALREGEARFRNMADHSPVMIWVTEPDGRCTYLNRSWYEFTGQDRGEAEGFGWLDAVHPDDRGWSGDAFVKANEDRKPFRLEYRLRRHDGTYRWAIDAASPRFGPSGEFLGFVGSVIDIDERREIEDALRSSESDFRSLANVVPAFVWYGGPDGQLSYFNDRWYEYSGQTPETALPYGWAETLHPEDVAVTAAAWAAAHETGTSYENECRYRRADGEYRWHVARAEPVRNEAGEVSGWFGTSTDIHDLKKAEEALRDQSRNLETLNRTGEALAAELDLQKVVQLVTDAGVDLTGAAFGAFFYNVLDDAGESYLLYTLSGASAENFDFGMPRNTKMFAPTFGGEGIIRSDDITSDPRYGQNPPHNGMPTGHLPVCSYLAAPVVSRSGEVIGGLFFGHPETGRFTEAHEKLTSGLASQAAISIDNARLYQAVQRVNETLEQRVQERTAELETAHEALRQAQKMEAIGQLTGGIAHDFNNMLTVIRGSADILQRGTVDEAKRERYIQAIADTSDRAARLTSQLLAFARRQALKPEVFEVTTRVHGIGEMLRTVLGTRVQLSIENECDRCFVETDTAQFETALVNMAVNARDAMDGEGKLRIGIGTADALGSYRGPQADSGYVRISVTDTGEGIAAADLDRIFEPFFTTKETGKGTGLGLSQVYGFAKQSGGEIEVQSEAGEGTTFTLYLPRASQSTAQDAAETAPARHVPADGCVLIVEDNPQVGQFAEQALADLGFETRRATTAAEALSLLESGHQFDVLFSDIVMPGQSGIDLARQVRRNWPKLPVILTTGYSDALMMHRDIDFPILHKPYSLDALSQALAKALHK